MPPQYRSLSLGRNLRGFLLATAAVVMVAGNLLSVNAASLTNASLLLSDPRTSETGVTYTFGASGFTASSAQCMTLQLNDAADGSGAVPTGIDTTGAALDGASTVITPASWTLDAAVNGLLEITFVTGEVPGNGNLIFTGIDNGSTEGTTYYGLFTTYSDACTTPIDSTTIAYVYRDGELVELTIEPTLTFSVNSIASGTPVNGAPNTTVTSGATGIDFLNNVTAVANGISAHELDVTTNASGGYIVYTRHTGDLTNGASDTITAHTGTNGTPTAFPAAGTEAWGYTTEDSTLTGGTADRFTTGAGNLWAGFTTTNQPVADNTAATAGSETTNVAHQVGISSTTESGTYQTTIIYTIVATY